MSIQDSAYSITEEIHTAVTDLYEAMADNDLPDTRVKISAIKSLIKRLENNIKDEV